MLYFSCHCKLHIWLKVSCRSGDIPFVGKWSFPEQECFHSNQLCSHILSKNIDLTLKDLQYLHLFSLLCVLNCVGETERP